MSEFRRFLSFLPEKGKTRFAGLSLFLSGESPRVDRLQSWNHVEFSKIKLRERQPIAWRLFAMYILLGNRNPNPVFDVRIGFQFLSVGRNASSLHGFDCLMNGVGECPNILNCLVFPNIESANVFWKTNSKLSTGVRQAGMLVGTTAPCILASRADSVDTKLNSIAEAVMSVL